MFFKKFTKCRKIIGGCILGAGVGILLILFLPPTVWFCIIGIGLVVVGIKKILER